MQDLKERVENALVLTVRAQNGLRYENIVTIEQLTSLRFSDICKIPNMGKVSANQIKEALSFIGLNLRPEPHPDMKYAPNIIRNIVDEQEKQIKFLQEREAKLIAGIRKIINDNLHLADGENCTLIELKRTLQSLGLQE